MQSEGVAVAAHEAVLPLAGHATQGRSPLGMDDEAGVHGQTRHGGAHPDLGLVQVRDLVAREVDRGDAGPARIHRLLGEVFLGAETERRRLDAHRQVFRHDGDLGAVLGDVHRDREDAAVVAAGAHARGQHGGVGVVQLDAQRAVVSDGHGEVEAAVLDAELVEVAQGLPREIADLGVVTFALEFHDHHDGDHHGVLREAEERPGVAQQDGGVQDVRAQGLIGSGFGLGALDDVTLVVRCSCSHNPLPTRVFHPVFTSRPVGHESRSEGRLDRTPCPM